MEIDEAKLERKHHKERVIDSIWIFSAVENSDKSRIFFMSKNQNSEASLGTIHRNIYLSSTIVGDS